MPPPIGAKLSLGETVRTLRFTWPALQWAADQLGGATLMRIVTHIGQLDTRTITVMVCAALRHEDKPPDLAETGALIQPPLSAVIDALLEALTPWIDIEGRGDASSGKRQTGTQTPSS